ncbi:hypothetical protein [Hirschia litorea]|uniref:Uncharacterized protein n=1 Tax=Hirschia litorea TaxID=1199156 RepID=A0ABW2INJ6_9PROT
MVKSLAGSGIVVALAMSCVSLSAYADGVNAPTVYTPKPSPLNVQNYSGHSHTQAGPVVHYANPSAAGTKIYSSACGHADTEVCSGQFVSTGRVVLAGEMPAYTQSVEPIYHEAGTYQGSVAPMASQPIVERRQTSSHHHDCHCDGHHTHGSQQIQMDGNMTGGVGAGVSSNWSGSRGGFLSVQYPMVRSGASVMYSGHSTYTPRHRGYVVRKRR